MTTRIQGLVPVLATPFTPDRALDIDGLRRLVEFELTSGVDGVALFGMASEGFALTAAERGRISPRCAPWWPARSRSSPASTARPP